MLNLAFRMKFFGFLVFALSAGSAIAQTTEFTYQGRLMDGSVAANGSYDFEFRLFAAATGEAELGIETRSNVAVASGIFTVRLDFGSAFDGSARWLEISVRPTGSPNFSLLVPRQSISSAPYAVRSLNSTTADTAITADNSLQLGGIAANQFVITTDSRMTDARNPLPFSANYIQNRVSQQPGTSNFNISGSGRADTFDALTEYRIQGDRIFGVPGNNNTFAGLVAGASNTSGAFNTFFGRSAGSLNNTGSGNTFVGARAGESNTSGTSNSFFGSSAGLLNTGGSNSFFGSNAGGANLGGGNNSFYGQTAGFGNTSGSDNTFIGIFAGSSNTTGFRNTIVGSGANVGNSNLTNATAIGWNAVVSASNKMVLGTNIVEVQVPGSLSVAGTLNASDAAVSNLTVSGTLGANGSGLTNLSAGNITSGTLSNARLGIVPIVNGGTGSATQNFVDLTTGQTVGGNKIFTSALNTQVQYNISGQRVLGSSSDQNNLFVGFDAGPVNASTGSTFVGVGAGRMNLSGQDNSFVGRDAGDANTSGSGNSFFGVNAGGSNIDGPNNTFLGNAAGITNTSGGSNTVIGFNADVGSNNLSNATAIGAGAVVNSSNTIVLGTVSDTVNVPGFFNIGGGGQITRMRTKTANLDFPNVDQTEEIVVAVPGVQLGDVVLLGLPSNAQIVLAYSAYVSSAGNVTVRAQHTTPMDPPVNPPSGVFRILVIGF